MKDPIGIFESAYVVTGAERQWLDRILDSARCEGAGYGTWITARTYDATTREVTVRVDAYSGIAETTAVAGAAQVALPKSEDPKLTALFRNVFVGTLGTSPAVLRRVGVDEVRIREFEEGIDRLFRLWGIGDTLWVNAQDPTGIGCLLVVPRARRGPLPPRETRRWSYVAAHLAAAFRIRRQLEGLLPRRAVDEIPQVEAILAPDGAVQHAREPARTRPARAALGDAAKALDRARGSLRRRDPEEAVAIWRAMVAGRWSLLDHFDTDGRRYILAHRNDPEMPDDARGLSLRERQVVAYASLGHSNKVIAYELGLSTSTVGTHLARARAKLASLSGGA